MSATIRHAREEDAAAILGLIQELAAYQKEPISSVEATVATLKSTIAFAPQSLPSALEAASVTSGLPQTEPISPTKPARCLLVFAPGSHDQKPIGFALYYYNYSTWQAKPGIHLEDLFVETSHRGKGYGKMLLKALAEECVANNMGRLEWCVLKWNKPSIGFYEGLGAQMMSDWVSMRVEKDALVNLSLMKTE